MIDYKCGGACFPKQPLIKFSFLFLGPSLITALLDLLDNHLKRKSRRESASDCAWRVSGYP